MLSFFEYLQLGNVKMLSLGEMEIWEEANALEKPLLSDWEWRFGISEKKQQPLLVFSNVGFGKAAVAMNVKKELIFMW